MRRFGKSKRRAFENDLALTNELEFLDGEFLQDDPSEAIISRPMVPQHIQKIFAAVVVMKERGIKAAAIEINWIGPGAINARAGDKVVVKVTQRRTARAAHRRAAITLYVGLNEPEQTVRVGETRRPNAARIRSTKHIELAGAIQRTREQPPVGEIAGMMNLHAGKPFEGGGGNIVIIADAHNGWIRIKACEDRISDVHTVRVCTAVSRRAASACSTSSTRN